MPQPVPQPVLDAFGLTGTALRLPGGEGRSVRVGDVVVKPVDDVGEATWAAALMDGLPEHGFRIARPVAASDGRCVVAGWTAARMVDGATGPAGHWEQLLAAGRAFHLALRGTVAPQFLSRRTHRWAVADRVAWGEATLAPRPEFGPLLARLEALRRPVAIDAQLVHGDLSGNVLFANGQSPAILDFSPYWRPAAYADAVVAVDGLLWYGAGRDLLTLAATTKDFPQLLLRALLFRLVALHETAPYAHAAARAELPLFHRLAGVVETLVLHRPPGGP